MEGKSVSRGERWVKIIDVKKYEIKKPPLEAAVMVRWRRHVVR